MILKEVSVERFAFTCQGCWHEWQADYDLQHVEDSYGHAKDYFFRDGVRCTDPTGAGVTLCPQCGRSTVSARLTHRRATPVVPAAEASNPDSGERPTAAQTAARARVPILPAEKLDTGTPHTSGE
ncbi:hypothetical protein CLV47_101445 [Antricoccus suffuscus]|uniref:Uncharacterized protein n=1 Tax=Antricoccus suffuscus TaxID=1629062 RepID=A0A2T1A6U1_9ACTN|nr:hypothetical protein [Antricoccus suffuscus]PRZ44319.1 hypothetical protein CLV47_101445 [Antricoccus suffuscus]